MFSRNKISISLLLILLSCIFGGCNEITGAFPDTSTTIEAKTGQILAFHVTGPPPGSITNEMIFPVLASYLWSAEIVGSDAYEQIFFLNIGRWLIYTVPSGESASNKIILRCRYGFHGSDGWRTIDSRSWNINVSQSTQPVWEGSYCIDNEQDLAALAGYTSITGNLRIIGTTLSSLAGLEGLRSIGIDLHIGNNDQLLSLVGLENLESIGDSLIISGNDSLHDISQLSGLTSLPGSLSLSSNENLKNLSGLDNITSVGSLNIRRTYFENLEAFSNISQIDEELYLYGNTKLISLAGLEGITAIGGEGVNIHSNNALTNLAGLCNVETVGSLYCSDNSALTSVEMNALTRVDDHVTFRNNKKLSSLAGLEGVATIGGGVNIKYNDALTNLAGLCNVETIGSLYCSDNPALTSVGMNALTRVDDYVTFENNSNLSTTIIDDFINQVLGCDGIGGSIRILGNLEP